LPVAAMRGRCPSAPAASHRQVQDSGLQLVRIEPTQKGGQRTHLGEPRRIGAELAGGCNEGRQQGHDRNTDASIRAAILPAEMQPL
jgi:hypothetical protein